MTHIIGRIARLKPEGADEYRRLHEEDWPGIRAHYAQAGFRRFRILHHAPEDLLVSVVEHTGPDPQAAFRALWAVPEIELFRALAGAAQAPLLSAPAGNVWAPMDLIFSDELEV